MSNTILFIFEGPKAENQIVDNLTKYFVNENTNVQCAYCGDIYQLYNKISQDEDFDTFSLLKERTQNRIALSSYTRRDFAEIYMFFDYDGHASSANDIKIKELLNLFNEETSFGKLFISYPMVEAIKHVSTKIDFKELKVKAKENIKYKRIVNRDCNKRLKNLTIYTEEIWIMLIEIHLKKMNYIANDDYSLPTKNYAQIDIFLNQLKKYIDVDSTVGVLSAFPVFLLDYYGSGYISKLLEKEQ